nr:immunoglobulin heavy chain junction region [Mus musculus]MBK4197896.1 immunoglobulin heavy chain junction region [Mus musculus]
CAGYDYDWFAYW